MVQVGPTVGHTRASLWTGTSDWINLQPAGADYSLAYAADGGRQVGTAIFGGSDHASLWDGTALGWVDLHPAGASGSLAYGISGNKQVGTAFLGFPCASLWSGTAGSLVNLNPPPHPVTGYGYSSEAFAVDGGSQVGYVNTEVAKCASLWSGSAGSWVNLHPAWATTSVAYGVSGGQQVGYVYQSGGAVPFHASVWTGSAASWVDLNPPAAGWSFAVAVSNGQQVGRAKIADVFHASLWKGTAASWVDLHTFLPAKYTSSEATAISREAGARIVVGTAFNSATGKAEAILWTNRLGTPTFTPAPGTYNTNQSVTISSPSAGATIYYTTDGTNPTKASPVYSAPISVTQSTKIKARAYKAGSAASLVATGDYTLAVNTPTFSPAPGTYTGSVDVTISTTTPGATIYYTKDGSTPTTASLVYSGPVHLTTTTTLKAKAFKTGWKASGVKSGNYKIK